MSQAAINLIEKLSLIKDQWSPRVIAEMNDIQFKLVKLEGDFVWHRHDESDEVFLVVQGEMQIGFRDHEVTIRQGELFVVPKGVEHITRAAHECHALIVEPSGIVNTGDAGGGLTAANDIWV